MLFTQLSGHWPEDTGADEFTGLVQQHASIVIEADVGSVGTTGFLLGADYDCLRDGSFLHVTARDGAFHGDDDDVARVGVTFLRSTQHSDKEYGYEQAELEVASENTAAIALYESLGFQVFGRLPRNMKYADGTYADMLWMMKLL